VSCWLALAWDLCFGKETVRNLLPHSLKPFELRDLCGELIVLRRVSSSDPRLVTQALVSNFYRAPLSEVFGRKPAVLIHIFLLQSSRSVQLPLKIYKQSLSPDSLPASSALPRSPIRGASWGISGHQHNGERLLSFMPLQWLVVPFSVQLLGAQSYKST